MPSGDQVFTDCFFSFDGVNLSAVIRSLGFPYESIMKDFTDTGSGGTMIEKGGFFQWSFTVEVNQNFADGTLDDVMWAKIGTTAAVVFRPANAAKSVDNPEFTALGTLRNWPPMDASAGDEVRVSFEVRNAGTMARDAS